MEKEKNYLIVGTGGVGGSIAGFLALGGKQVTCIARGAQLEAIRQYGLHLKSDLKGEHWLKVPACTAEAYEGKADVIFVCVKGYALDSIQDLLRRVATPDTLVVPILNVYGTGERLARLVPEVTVLDGCIYIVGFISGPGEITQSMVPAVASLSPANGWMPWQKSSADAVLRWMYRRISTATRLSSGRLFRPWLVPVPTSMCRWARYNMPVKCATCSPDCLARVRRSAVVWGLPSHKIRSPII